MTASRRWLFVVTILTGSFLLFLVQPLVARMALPRLGGAPAVWNSAMLVYQALLLGGYAYAHAIARLSVARQATVHLVLLVFAGLTLPIALAPLAPPAAGYEALWAPLVFVLTIGPVFFVVAAQAPLMQRWYAAEPDAGDPYWLYAASNLGSFGGLIAYPLLLEPNLSLAGQSLAWSAGYALLIVLVALAAISRPKIAGETIEPEQAPATVEPIGWRRIALWLALAAVPSGLMLSTTTHLTTDVVAVPLLWVIPLGLYLLSFVLAFNPRSALGHALARSAPTILLLAGGMAMVSRNVGSLTMAFATVVMLLVVAVALHRRLYAERPGPARLTFFYLVMSAGGVLGGLFAALVAPLVFDWVWEHPLLVLAAAALLPNRPFLPWMERLGLDPRRQRTAVLVVLLVAAVLSMALGNSVAQGDDTWVVALMIAIALCGLLVMGRRPAFVLVLVMLMLARGGYETLRSSFTGARERSYFGIYHVREGEAAGVRQLTHGTTMHGLQFTDPARALRPTTYYGPDSGVGIALRHAPELVGPAARIGVVGLGVGTLACYARPGQEWHFFEIDPAVLEYSRDGTFTFLERCTPGAAVHLGDARLALADMPEDRFDVLVLDAFSSDAIPLHLVTYEAFGIYDRVVARDGLVLLHISNRFVDLQPMVRALADRHGMLTVMRHSEADADAWISGSLWVAMSRDPETLAALLSAEKESTWHRLPPPAERVWTDDFASILPFLVWRNVLGSGS